MGAVSRGKRREDALVARVCVHLLLAAQTLVDNVGFGVEVRYVVRSLEVRLVGAFVLQRQPQQMAHSLERQNMRCVLYTPPPLRPSACCSTFFFSSADHLIPRNQRWFFTSSEPPRREPSRSESLKESRPSRNILRGTFGLA